MNSNSERLAAILTAGGIAFKDVWMGQHTGILTFWGEPMARRAAMLLQRASFKVTGGPREQRDYAKENKNTVLRPSTVKVWRVWISI